MIEKRSLDKITVKDIVEACGISRQTFYYHFQDILDVVEWLMEKSLEKRIAESVDMENAEEALEKMITYSPKEKEIMANLLRSQHRAQVERVLIKTLRNYLFTMMKSRNLDVQIGTSDMDVLLDFWTFGIVGVIISSLSRGELDEHRLAGQILDLITGKISLKEN